MKVEVSEKEARSIGQGRWMDKNKWRWFALVFIPVIAMIIFGVLNDKAELSNWISLPILLAFGGLAVYSLLDGIGLCERAGKEFLSFVKGGNKK